MSVIQCHWPVCLQASWIATVLPQHRHVCNCSFWCRLFWTTELVLLSCKHFHILSSWLKTQIFKELWRSESWTSQIYTIFYKLRASVRDLQQFCRSIVRLSQTSELRNLLSSSALFDTWCFCTQRSHFHHSHCLLSISATGVQIALKERILAQSDL